LSDLDQGKVPFRDIDNTQMNVVIREPEQNISGAARMPLPLWRPDLAVLRRRPTHVDREFARTLYLGNDASGAPRFSRRRRAPFNA